MFVEDGRMDVLGRRNGAEKRKWTSGESQVNSIHNVGFIISSGKAHSACPCRTGPRSAVVNVSGYNIANLAADPGVASSIPAWSHTFVEIDHEIISTLILLASVLPLNHSRRVVVSYKRKYVHELLDNCLFKLAQEKVWLGELTVPP